MSGGRGFGAVDRLLVVRWVSPRVKPEPPPALVAGLRAMGVLRAIGVLRPLGRSCVSSLYSRLRGQKQIELGARLLVDFRPQVPLLVLPSYAHAPSVSPLRRSGGFF